MNPQNASTHSPLLSLRARSAAASKIREVAEEGMRVGGVVPLWFGEASWPSPNEAVESAVEALHRADHHYQPNSGKPALREALAAYQTRLYGQDFKADRISVTASGMQGMALAAQAIVDPGDKVVCIEPAWPNIVEVFRLTGGYIQLVSLSPRGGRWQLDVDDLIDAVGTDSRAVVVNSPSNPTGWVMPEADQRRLLEHCRSHGIWIIADDVYARLVREGTVAPSFLSMATPEDRILSVNSFSKAWSMTGWRLGWITAPAELEASLAELTEFNIAGPAGFIQTAGLCMIATPEPEIDRLKSRLSTCYSMTAAALRSVPGVRFVEPDGAFYCFFQIEGLTDSLSFAKRMIHEAKVGLAPGIAFGPSGEGCMRLCYAQPTQVLEPALARLVEFLSNDRAS